MAFHSKSSGRPIPESEYEASDGVSTTTAGTYQDKVTITIPALDGQIWDIYWSCEAYNNSSNQECYVRLYNDTDADTLAEALQEDQDDYCFQGGVDRVTFSGDGDRDLILQWYATGGTALIRRARILALRIK